MWPNVLFYTALFATIIYEAGSLSCYRCHSSQPGCGRNLNIRLQRREGCDGPGGSEENFCVKIIDRTGSKESYTRECVSTLLHHTGHREKLPTVRRHGYCEPARNNDPYARFDDTMIYCFCNDQSGCNTASGLHRLSKLTALLVGLGSVLLGGIVRHL